MLGGIESDWGTIFRVVGGGAARCAFCEILAGKRSAHMVFKEENTAAFLDSRPLFLGHCLLVPTSHYETIADVPDGLVGELFLKAKALAMAVQVAMGADGTFIAINNRVSQSVPHIHVHVVPRRRGDGLRGFFWPRTKYADEKQAEEVAQAIRSKLEQIKGG